MPGFDGTGPRGAGPMTGGGRGYCNTSGKKGYGMGRGGRPRGCGGGRGWGRGYGRDMMEPPDQVALQSQKEIEELKARIQELEQKLKSEG